MSVAAQTLRPPSRTLMFLESRAIHELGAFLGALPLLSLAPRGDGHPVLVLPGLIASDMSTRPLRDFLKSKGYAVSGWRQGRNLGLRAGVQDRMVDLLQEMNRESKAGERNRDLDLVAAVSYHPFGVPDEVEGHIVVAAIDHPEISLDAERIDE